MWGIWNQQTQTWGIWNQHTQTWGVWNQHTQTWGIYETNTHKLEEYDYETKTDGLEFTEHKPDASVANTRPVYTQIQIRAHFKKIVVFLLIEKLRVFSVFRHRPGAVLFINVVFCCHGLLKVWATILVVYVYMKHIWLCAKRCACKGLCTSAENKTLLKTVFIWNVVLCTCMNEWIYSTDNFSNQAVVDLKIQSSHTEKALKNDRQKRTSMYWVIFVTLLTNKSQAHGETITDLYLENIVLYG